MCECGAGIRIEALGGFRVVAARRERREARSQPIRSALLVYLAVEGEATRDTLLGLFWPELPEARARHALSQALHKLRRELGREWVHAEGEALLVDASVEIDARAFEQAVSRGQHREALELYSGHFLEGWRLHATSGFELWVDAQRDRLTSLFAKASREDVRAREGAGDGDGALDAARRWARLCPLDDAAHGAFVEALVCAGRRAEAARHYDAILRRRAEEGLAPSPDFVTRAARALSIKGKSQAASGPRAVDCVVVLPLENATGREDLEPLGRLAADWIVEGLDRAAMARVVPVLDALRTTRAVPPSDARGDVRVLELARESQAGTLVSGSFYILDEHLELRAQVVDVSTGELRASAEPVRVAPGDVAQGVALLRDRVLGVLAAALDTRWSGLPSPPELGVHPPAYDAYRAYASGLEPFLAGDYTAAVPWLECAAALDPGFSRPRFLAAAALGHLGEWERVVPHVCALEGMAARLSPYEAGSLRWQQATLAGDRELAHALSSAGWHRYPGTLAHFVAVLDALAVNRPRAALDIARQLEPGRGWLRELFLYWDAMTTAHHMVCEHEAELEHARRGRSAFPALVSALACEARSLAAAGDSGRLAARLRELEDLPPQRGFPPARVLRLVAGELRAHGRPERAVEYASRAVEWLRLASVPGALGAASRGDLAAALYEAGSWDEAAALFRQLAAEFPSNLDFRARLGVLAARGGQHELAAAVDRELADSPKPFLFGRNTLWRARIVAVGGEPARAVSLLRRSCHEGLVFGLEVHVDPDLATLRGSHEFQEFLRPKG